MSAESTTPSVAETSVLSAESTTPSVAETSVLSAESTTPSVAATSVLSADQSVAAPTTMPSVPAKEYPLSPVVYLGGDRYEQWTPL